MGDPGRGHCSRPRVYATRAAARPDWSRGRRGPRTESPAGARSQPSPGVLTCPPPNPVTTSPASRDLACRADSDPERPRLTPFRCPSRRPAEVQRPPLAPRLPHRSRRRRQGPPPRPYDTATIGAALARALPAHASAGRDPPAWGRATAGRWTAALANRSRASVVPARDGAQLAARAAGWAGRAGLPAGPGRRRGGRPNRTAALSSEPRRAPG